ncbi:sensor histidine kinase [Sphingomonas abaci]|uniref:histidine kinase n=1 Tax=Sphingomonas abaci TaxID=237611 RepID=A0A7W7AHA3_9SPHN|nr:HAMP domain-containing sensor histidine kinase [Sphingomonas abaci]MBB4617019.1 signal transduction histidine kinase [Sphingomonas abaci]
MIESFKRVVRRHWPRLRLRTILLLTFTFVAALPGFGALFLRVYENALVRQTEAELIAQGAALSGAAALAWHQGGAIVAPRVRSPSIDLRATPILPVRPAPIATAHRPDAGTRDWAKRLAPILRVTAAATGADLLLLDRQGMLLTGRQAGRRTGDLAEVRTALGGQPGIVLRRDPAYRHLSGFAWLSRSAGLRIDLAVPIVADGRVVGALLLSHPPRTLLAGLYDDRGKIAFGIVLIFSTLVVLSGLLSRGIVRPVEALGVATRAVAGGGGTVPDAPTTAAIEIQALYRDFGSMAAAIARRSRYLRDFAHAVSHEFKTPLAGIRGAVELLQDHPDMPPADRDRFLANIAADGARLTQLVSRLLDLARADMEESAEGVTADLHDAVRRIADAQAGIVIESDMPDHLPRVALPQGAVEAVLSSLVDNSRQAGATRMRITGEDNRDVVILTVGDDGPGIPPGDRARVFDPFFTSRRTEGGTGLGLPIARSLLEAQGGTIALAPNAGGGATFRIALPVSRCG